MNGAYYGTHMRVLDETERAMTVTLESELGAEQLIPLLLVFCVN